jgi:hypothetical protein
VTDLSDTTTVLDNDAVIAFPVMGKVEGHSRRAMIRKARKLAAKRIAGGNRNAQSVAEEVQTELMADSEVGSILTIIGIAILSALIEWIVKKLLDRWTLEHDDA